MPKKVDRLKSADAACQPSPDKTAKRHAADWLTRPADPLDVWLRNFLHQAFDHVCDEPIPDDILRLVEEDRGERERIRLSRLSKQQK
jgi:hypothetical protein